MSDAREAILGRIHRALGRDPLDAEAIEALRERLQSPPSAPRPQWSESRLQRFQQRVEASAATFERVGPISAVPERARAYLEAQGLAPALAVAPALKALPWPDSLKIHYGPIRGEHAVSLTPCFTAVAETGSLVLISGPDTPTSLNFLPDDHLVVVLADQVVDHLEDAWTRLRGWPPFPTRTVNFITGPSRTADVEQTIQLGAHGPRRLHVLLVDG